MEDLAIIENAFAERQNITATSLKPELRQVIDDTINKLDSGEYRVAEKINGEWQVHEWLKKAVLLQFKIYSNEVVDAGYTRFYDKVPLKFVQTQASQFAEEKLRIVPGAVVRKSAYLAANTVLMPCFVNVGAYVDSGTLVDTWASVGSCAQIGKNVHLSGGVGIGGVLEPLQARPTIIEDNCFIGARSEIVEGVVVEANSVISMGVYIGQSTPIYNRQTGDISYGRVPQGSVVVAGSLPSADGKYNRYAAIIVKQIDEKTRAKTSLNDLLRDIE